VFILRPYCSVVVVLAQRDEHPNSRVERLTYFPCEWLNSSKNFLSPAPDRRGFFISAAMKFPEPQESRAYGNPEDVIAARQEAAANRARRAAETAANAPVPPRRTLTVRKGWAARKAIEALFDFPAAASQ
jgi:hypothetical protein